MLTLSLRITYFHEAFLDFLIKINSFVPQSTTALYIFMMPDLKFWRSTHTTYTGTNNQIGKKVSIIYWAKAFMPPIQNYGNM